MTEPIKTMIDPTGAVYLGITLDAHTTVFISANEADHLQQCIRFTLSSLRKCDV